uniref:Annexin n=1 Tax=Geotrypetes seraphini TaxID=260995 RepID=A0A6P8PD75_GEOSA|nr:annexin A9 [Geotrypetes seraphini]XP_033779049.1 annexin A9 [Geotrypetes seraphini]XP_033779050.1 annexin A9 [Geotrypetes seraphini]XP_033779051.1 annexin A9 [Geotrypetes seraphini]XP_033779053.1 annexin A9 [Geotrypetes seraphini]
MSLAREILSKLYLAEQCAIWGTLGTIRPHPCFDVENDVEILRTALAGAEKDIILDLVTGRSNSQRQHLIQHFATIINQDLVKALEGALSGNLEKIILGLLKPPAQYDAHELKAAMKGLGTDEDTLTEILITRSNQQLREIGTFYREDYKADLEQDVTAETSGHFRELLLTLLKGKRERDSGIIDYALIMQDAKALSDTGMKNSSPNVHRWISILSERSMDHLRRVFEQYKMINSSEVEDKIQKQFKGDFERALLSLVSVIRNTPLYFADKLHTAMKGMGTDRKTLTRILISRSETDLLCIRVEFKRKYGKSLYSFLQTELKGEYQSALLALCRAED